ncbi:ABC transporter permease [Actinomadura verrucosospora]|uniref:Multidrug ABC transporter permease n=1 Tax=Actinomadura verrucosospora TaxID=46165 RepID=A0A7D3VXM0_ACTVE|nr:ABC transporter permease [Actinomadura verrucosospora]QKG25873.1 multidrug ABC transporter permease [Actinomadura verrucosospora]
MNTRTIALGVRRGWAEHVHAMRSRRELIAGLGGTVAVFVLMIRWQGGHDAQGTHVSEGLLLAAGFVAFCVFSTGLMNLAMMIAADREEGTLLRLRTVPGGVPAYVVGRAVSVLLQIVTYVVLMLVAGMAFAGLELPSDPARWLTLLWVLALGTLAVVPFGAVLGTLLPGPRNAASILSLPVMGLMVVSGVLFPVTSLPEPVQWIAQAFPLYWEGLGLRSAFLPDAMLAGEIGGSWRPLETAGMLGAWAAAGLLVAPMLLLRAARRESGARLAARRERRAAQGAF